MTVGETLPMADQTEIGSYFVATYPPFSVWRGEKVETEALPALNSAPQPGVPLGLYLHIPFCRKRCHFCYFRVYTDKNSDEVSRYLDLVGREWELYAQLPAVANRGLNFVYFGGGTPSFLSTTQLRSLVNRLTANLKMSSIPVGGTPEEFSAFVRQEIVRWGKVVRDNNVRVE